VQICIGDLDIAARTVYGEARGESNLGRLAVARVLVNRWQATFGQWAKDDTLASACLRHLQFSGWTASDPNYSIQMEASFKDRVLLECWQAVIDALLMDAQDDPTRGSLHYHSDSIAVPAWVPDGASATVIIGRHRFYNNIA